MAIGGVPDSFKLLLNQAPSLSEVCEHAITANWYQLGIQLQLDSVDLANIRKLPDENEKLPRMYDIWLNKRGESATRQELLTALRSKAVAQNSTAFEYENYLKEMVSLLNLHKTFCQWWQLLGIQIIFSLPMVCCLFVITLNIVQSNVFQLV